MTFWSKASGSTGSKWCGYLCKPSSPLKCSAVQDFVHSHSTLDTTKIQLSTKSFRFGVVVKGWWFYITNLQWKYSRLGICLKLLDQKCLIDFNLFLLVLADWFRWRHDWWFHQWPFAKSLEIHSHHPTRQTPASLGPHAFSLLGSLVTWANLLGRQQSLSSCLQCACFDSYGLTCFGKPTFFFMQVWSTSWFQVSSSTTCQRHTRPIGSFKKLVSSHIGPSKTIEAESL